MIGTIFTKILLASRRHNMPLYQINLSEGTAAKRKGRDSGHALS